jgi:hypothetical protein
MKTLLPVRFMTSVGFVVMIGLGGNAPADQVQTTICSDSLVQKSEALCESRNKPDQKAIDECKAKVYAECRSGSNSSSNDRCNAEDNQPLDKAHTAYTEACNALPDASGNPALKTGKNKNSDSGDVCKERFEACRKALKEKTSCTDDSSDDEGDDIYPKACGGPPRDVVKDLESELKDAKEEKKTNEAKVNELKDSINTTDRQAIFDVQKQRQDALDAIIKQQTQAVNGLRDLSNKMKGDAMQRMDQSRQAYLDKDSKYVMLRAQLNSARTAAMAEQKAIVDNCSVSNKNGEVAALFANWMAGRQRARNGLSGASISRSEQIAKMNELSNLCMSLAQTQSAVQLKNQKFQDAQDAIETQRQSLEKNYSSILQSLSERDALDNANFAEQKRQVDQQMTQFQSDSIEPTK